MGFSLFHLHEDGDGEVCNRHIPIGMVLHETRSKSFDATYAHEQLNNFQAWWHLCTQLLPTTQRGMLFEILR